MLSEQREGLPLYLPCRPTDTGVDKKPRNMPIGEV